MDHRSSHPERRDGGEGQVMQLYEFGPTRSIRVRRTLRELGVDFEAVSVNLLAGEHRRPEFLRINPAGKVPVLVGVVFQQTADEGDCRVARSHRRFWAHALQVSTNQLPSRHST
jgi:Glutathione S-transferase, N-terminal domain